MPGRRRARPAIRRGGQSVSPRGPHARRRAPTRVGRDAWIQGRDMPVPKRERVCVARPGVSRARLGREGRRRGRLPAETHPRAGRSPRPRGWPARRVRNSVSNVRYVLGLSNPGFARPYQYVVPRAALFGAIISGVLAAEAPQKPRLGASTAHSRPPHSTRALTSAVRRGSREEARSRSTGDARRVRSRGRSLPVSWSQRADDGLASSALAERDVTRASVVRIQSRETQNTVSPCRTSWRRSPRSSWR